MGRADAEWAAVKVTAIPMELAAMAIAMTRRTACAITWLRMVSTTPYYQDDCLAVFPPLLHATYDQPPSVDYRWPNVGR